MDAIEVGAARTALSKREGIKKENQQSDIGIWSSGQPSLGPIQGLAIPLLTAITMKLNSPPTSKSHMFRIM
jgi:hypothetical protein